MNPRGRLNIGNPTQLAEIDHSTHAQFRDQRFDRVDERRASFTRTQLESFADFTIQFVKVYDSHRKVQEIQRNGERLSTLNGHPLRYIIIPPGAPEWEVQQDDEDVVDGELGGWKRFEGQGPPPVDALPEDVGAWVSLRLDWAAVNALLQENRFAGSSDRYVNKLFAVSNLDLR